MRRERSWWGAMSSKEKAVKGREEKAGGIWGKEEKGDYEEDKDVVAGREAIELDGRQWV